MLKTKEIKLAILAEFGSLQKCSEAMGIDQSTLSRNLEKPTLKTLDKLEEVGVVFSSTRQSLAQLKKEIETKLEIIKLKDEVISLQRRTIENLEARCNLIGHELKRVNKAIKSLQKDCKYKDNCLLKNMEIEGPFKN